MSIAHPPCARSATPAHLLPAALPPAATDADAAVFTVSEVTVSAQLSWLSTTGRLVGESAAAQLAEVLKWQRVKGRRLVRLDLTQCLMLDHAGFDTLVAAHQAFLDAGGTLILTGVGPRIARLLHLTGLDQTLFVIASATDPPPAEQAPTRAATAEDEAGQRVLIDRAVGVVMGRTRCSVAQATEELVVLGHATNRTLGEVAQSILDNTAQARTRTTHRHRGRSDRDRPAHRAGLLAGPPAGGIDEFPGPGRSDHGDIR